jgi:hypothetical protein
MFPLCRKFCGENSNLCSHNDEERSIEGTWVTLEIFEAIKLGYKILKIYESWNYKVTDQYDPLEKKEVVYLQNMLTLF